MATEVSIIRKSSIYFWYEFNPGIQETMTPWMPHMWTIALVGTDFRLHIMIRYGSPWVLRSEEQLGYICLNSYELVLDLKWV